ncbi:hypothetical protein GEMRC1_010186 [Eukaryota sp. GEM-RC1]
MNCSTCYQSFNLSDRVPVLICCEGHSCCSRCSQKLKQCPLCRLECLKERKVNFALKDLIKASRDGDLCPQIPSDQIVLGDKIAEGGFALIYAAEWFDILAIKMVSLTDKGKKELQREMSLLFSLNHPSILRVFGLTFFDDSVAIVMEKASSHIPSPTLLSSTTLRYAKELCQAVKFLHLKSVVHGDLKPANILLVDGHVRVADFGTSRNLADTTLVTRANLICTKYAAPEQFDLDPCHFSDIYSIGLILYELLTGKGAFDGYSTLQIVGRKLGNKPLLFENSIPECLQDLIIRCLNPDLSARPVISQLIDSLNNLNVLVDSIQSFDQDIIRSDEENEILARENSKLLQHCNELSNLINFDDLNDNHLAEKVSKLENDNQKLSQEVARLNLHVLTSDTLGHEGNYDRLGHSFLYESTLEWLERYAILTTGSSPRRSRNNFPIRRAERHHCIPTQHWMERTQMQLVQLAECETENDS